MNTTPLESWIAAKAGLPGSNLARADLETYQRRKLWETVAWARANSRFYWQLLADAPVELPGQDDLAALPFTTADDLRRDPLALLCVSQDEIHRVVTLDTSGTTGRPKRLFFTREDQALTIDFFHIGMSTFTAPGDRVLILLPGQTPGSVGDLLATALERLGAVPVKHGPVTDPAATMNMIRERAIDVLVGVPVHLLALTFQPPAPQLKAVLFATDHVPDPIRAAVEHTWGCRAYDHYGMTEMGLGGGVECEARRGYHLREADLLFEIVDPQTGAVVEDGGYGEIVFTTLTRRGMPLIRYRTGDHGRFIPGSCTCGTRLKTLERVAYRYSTRAQVAGRQLAVADLDRILFAFKGVRNYSAALDHEGGGDMLHLSVELDGAAGDPPRRLKELSDALAPELPATLAVHITQCDRVPLTMAKRTLLDRRRREA